LRRYYPTLSRFDTIPECDRQTDTHTHTHTQRHKTTVYTALSKASRGKNLINVGPVTMEITLLSLYFHMVTWRKSAYGSSLVALAFQTRWTIGMAMGALKAAMIHVNMI